MRVSGASGAVSRKAPPRGLPRSPAGALPRQGLRWEDWPLDARPHVAAPHRDRAPVARPVAAPHPLLHRELAEKTTSGVFHGGEHGVGAAGVDRAVTIEVGYGIEDRAVRTHRPVNRRNAGA